MKRPCICCSVKILAVITAVLVVVLAGILLLSFYGIPRIVNSQVDASVRLTENSDQWGRFLKLPIPIYIGVYLFTVRNGPAVMNGAVPKLEEVGPYVFREDISKKVLSTNKDDDSVTYQKFTEQSFEQERSGQLTLDDNVTIVNPPLLVLTQITSVVEQLVVVGCLDKIFTPTYRDLFMTTTIRSVMFEGFEFARSSSDVGYACEVIRQQIIEKTKKMKNIRRIYSKEYPGMVEALRFSFLGFKTESPDGIYTLNRGIDDISKLGRIMQWNNSHYLPFWGTSQSINNDTCQLVEGGDSTMYPPHATKDKGFVIFSTDICRRVEVSYSSTGTYKDIEGYRYEPKSDTFYSKLANVEEDCFCTGRTLNPNGVRDCYLNGVIDVYDCFGAPLLLSFPHFLHADESYINGVQGVTSPDPEKHGIYLLIEPNTGTPLQGRKRVQLNVVLRNIEYIQFTQKLKPTVLPVIWIEECADLTDDLINILNNQFFKVVKIANGVKYGLIAVSSLSVLVVAGILIRKQVISRRK
ncbi:sensory neuron membrane protein 2 [Diabrotica virgifera virgifera]|uniref:Sensory neuron membrane protein 2 n=1 Tax=Diabrotica virgifera virgifera TaxID=50390 RepID=A0ABM5IJI0_DIAVI|nr:sensory neuron membrane protein 2 [Diabrotica virgifera virgifera]